MKKTDSYSFISVDISCEHPPVFAVYLSARNIANE